MTEQGVPAQLQRILDRQEISDRLAIWCRSVDTRDFGSLSGVFHRDVTWDFGEGVVDHGLAQIIKRIEAHMLGASYCGKRQIRLSNLCTRFANGGAVSDAYFFAISAGTGKFQGQTLLEWGAYHDTWQQSEDGWRIVRRDYRNEIRQGPLEILYGTAPPELWNEGDARRLDGKR